MAKKDEKKATPGLRFPKFRGAEGWDLMKLSDLLFESKQRNRQLKFGPEHVLSVSGEYGCVNQIELLGRSYAGVSVKDYHVVETGEIVYTKSPLKKNPFGIIKENKGVPGIVSTLYAVYHATDLGYPEYLDHYFSGDYNLNSYLQPIVKKGAKNDMKVNNSAVLSGDIWVPKIAEQKMIAAFLTSLDELIAAQGRKVEALKVHKRGLMQELFPHEGETRPRLRFPEFREGPVWGELTVGDMGEVITGNTPATSQREYYDGEYLFVSPGDISDMRLIESTKTTLTEEGFAQCRPIKPWSVLFVCIGSTIGKVAQNIRECATNQQINSVVPSSLFSGDFIYYLLLRESERIRKFAGRQAVPIINKTSILQPSGRTMTLDDIANKLRDSAEPIALAYAFNATGKTQLCVAYKNATKNEAGEHTGVYYNAYSEDLFVWDNDEEQDGANIRLTVLPSSLGKFHTLLTEDNIRDKLNAYKPKYGFLLNLHEDDPEKGIKSVSFFLPDQNPDLEKKLIKISRGEERIFVWCFFLALFEVEGWADRQSSHFFIDDPVSSLDDHNIFITAWTLFNLIESNFDERKIIVTTHHFGLFSILSDWLTKGEMKERFKKNKKPLYKLYVLSTKSGELELENQRGDVFLYHLRLLQLLANAQKAKDVRAYHFALLRQVLENIASFLGVGQFSYVLEQIGISDKNRVADIVNALSHKKIYYFESDIVVQDNLDIFNEVISGLLAKYNFVLHAE